VCVVGYSAGGAFLNLGYYDFPYYVMAIVCITYGWVRRESWQTDRPEPGGWRTLIGLADATDAPGATPSGTTGAAAGYRRGNAGIAATARPPARRTAHER